jgi:uncharacterized protein
MSQSSGASITGTGMNPSKVARRLREHVAPVFTSDLVGHDLGHLDRVWRYCARIAAAEGGDLEVLAAAAYLHDYHRVPQGEEGPWRRPVEVLEPVVAALDVVHFDASRRSLVIQCIAQSGTHSFAGEVHSGSLEAAILSDADALDAMGAIGIARAFMFGGWLREPLWIPETPVAHVYTRGVSVSVVHHLHEKLLRLEADLSTPSARSMALVRQAVMREYLRTFEAEWNGRELTNAGGDD